MWIIRDKDQQLYVSVEKPWKNYRSPDEFEWFCDGYYFQVESDQFDDLQYEDEPMEVKLVPKR